MLSLRNATEADLGEIRRIYEYAQDYMIRSGNPTQWGHFYPSADLIGGVGELGELADLEGQRTAGELHFILVVAGKLTVGDDGGHDHTPFQIFVGSLVRPFST